MSVSLNTVNQEVARAHRRIDELANKISQSNSIIESKLESPGYVKFSNGLIINFGTIENNPGYSWQVYNFSKPFTTKFLTCVVSGSAAHFDSTLEYYFTKELIRARYLNDGGGENRSYIAIGYLITNRVRNLIKSLFNKVFVKGGETPCL